MCGLSGPPFHVKHLDLRWPGRPVAYRRGLDVRCAAICGERACLICDPALRWSARHCFT